MLDYVLDCFTKLFDKNNSTLDKKNDVEEIEIEGRSVSANEHMENSGHVKFEHPKVPVIFILGGPGSGKVTHCDSLSEEKRGIIHINMTDLLQQYTIGSADAKDYNLLSSRTVAEVLMLEMKMSPAAKTFLISGYPRNMRDVVEYTDKIRTVNGVILMAWQQISLERQIEYGAKLGHVVLSLARLELNNFYKHVTPVADFYDQRQMLITINGERSPAEVYNDFRAAVLRILGSQNEAKPTQENSIPNGKAVLVDSASVSKTADFSVPVHQKNGNITSNSVPPIKLPETVIKIDPSINRIPTRIPTVVYVIGGPGSNKANLIHRVLRRVPGWVNISMGASLRAKVDSRELPILEAEKLRNTIAAGEMVEAAMVMETLEQALHANMNASGIILDGYPRDLDELHEFENKYHQHPPIILLDCSKLQLGRGRWDDSVAAFRKRLEIFREKTLPMLKVLDTEHRLTMVDGDTDTPEVQESFTLALFEAIQHAEEDAILEHGDDGKQDTQLNFEAAILQDLEDDILDNMEKVQMNGYGPPKDNSQQRKTVSVTHGGSTERILPSNNV